ncbi:sensor histidine kinase [Alteraurantiacibacter aquimixticola]|uniref:histidine kinase n=1 Tax=Alteraurantiacibacter aquimixticola TaxID=2489173 RepID=A0A4V4U8Z0_9SPHN|nr:histidine kinase dimerization/phospho-acceptor domain-containing protein [Alteraurantiacibacter aquimixticola]TIX51887.1 HAMP domain-containing histidine kinase [Alteraurantiacibacter aquimixticola]
MLFDDRLATVLRSPTRGEAAARTQFRQLLDLLGSAPADEEGLTIEGWRQLSEQAAELTPEEREQIMLRPALEMRDQHLLTFLAFYRLGELAEAIPAEERSRILREPGLRLRNRRLVHVLAEGDAKPAAAAVATARLTEEDWLALIPQMPVMARGFLRHRRDLPPSAKELLAQLGVRDHVLPMPEGMEIPLAEPEAEPVPEPAAPAPAVSVASAGALKDRDGIRTLLLRIEAFREGRRDAASAPRLPLGDTPEDTSDTLTQFAFTTDREGRIDWADMPLAPLVAGMRLDAEGPGVIAVLEDDAAKAMQQRRPLRNARLTIDAAPAIAGEWRVDAAPVFTEADGYFTGFSGRMRRALPAPVEAVEEGSDTAADRMRQLLHELRTPVNAIQGFAEIIQQQVFGPAPNEYRALAAAVAVDAAKLLAGFDEVDRMSRLETRALALEPGDGDLREVVVDTLRRLDGALRSRGAGFDLITRGSPFTPGIARPDLLGLTWRILASLGGALAPAERCEVELTSDGEHIAMRCQLPASLSEMENPLCAPLPEKRPALSSGMFGTGFSLRLARAELASVGGSLIIADGWLEARLGILTPRPALHSTGERNDDAA